MRCRLPLPLTLNEFLSLTQVSQVIATITSLLSLVGSSYMIGDFVQRYLEPTKAKALRLQDEV
jgi:hypothetical protein